MKNKLFALLLLFTLPVVAQDKVKLYDEMCDPLQAVFCDYVGHSRRQAAFPMPVVST